MTKDLLLDLLVRWVLEWGREPVSYAQRFDTVEWYMHHPLSVDEYPVYFKRGEDNCMAVTQAGLDYIANGGAVEGLDYIGQRQMSESRQEPVGGEG